MMDSSWPVMLGPVEVEPQFTGGIMGEPQARVIAAARTSRKKNN